MRRWNLFLERLQQSDQPPESQSPILVAGAAALVAFVITCWLGSHYVTSLRLWWTELLVYPILPSALAFILLHRSCWHQEMRRSTRALLLALTSCAIFVTVVVIAALAMVVVALAFFSCFNRFGAFHY